MRRRASLAVLGAGVLAAGLLTASSATAIAGIQSLPGSSFEIDTDANLVADNAAPWIDWDSVDEIRKEDTASGSTDESFGQGAKEDTAAPVIVDGSIPPNKSDLKYFGVYQEGTTSAGFLNLFWSRVQDPSGTTNMDFELNARQCTPNATPVDADCSANGVTPIRTDGDLLITYDLAKGGTVPAISIREWQNGAWGAAVILTDPQQTKAAGSINTSEIVADDSDGLGAQSPRTFGEAQIDLSAIFDDPDACQSFGSAYLKSRASDSFTAALKDFVPPEPVNISNCGSVNIVKTDDAGTALNGAEFTLYDDNDPVYGANPPLGATRGNEDTITDPVLKCTTAGTGTNEGKCTITNVPFGHYWVVETVTPANHDTAADQPAVLSSSATSVTLTFVNPRILQPTISTAQSFVPNDSATVTVGSGRGDLSGSVRFRLYDNQTCTGDDLYDSGAIDVTTGTGTGLSRTVSSANTTAYTTNKTFSWLVEYSSTNNGHLNVTSVCDKERSSITILNNNPNPGSTS